MADSSRSETPETSGHIDKSAADATGDGHDRVSHKSAISNHNPKAPNVTIDFGGLLSHGEPADHSSAKPAEPEAAESAEEGVENPERPKGIRFVIVYSCILLGDFFVGYDTSCVTTLTPLISDEFKAIGDVGWYGIAYILALASSVLTFGQLYTIFPMKAIFLASFIVFAIGSTVCATAPSSIAFIIGRAITGLGGAGIFSGGTIIVANTTSLKRRPIYQGISGGMECTALAFGPLVSGTISNFSSWRISFYIIIPIAVVNILAIWLHISICSYDRLSDPCAAIWRISICLGNARIIVLFVLAGALAIAFFFAQRRAGDKAMFPLHLLRQRSVTLGSASMFCVSASLFVFGFYLPIYFQAIRHATTLQSGLMYLPTALSFAISIFVAGNITSWLGYYTPVMVTGTALMSVGAGLMTSFSEHTSTVEWIWFQILFGVGAGLAFQQPYTAIQTVLPEKHVATAIVVLSFTQELGGIVALAVSQNIFLNQLISKLKSTVPQLDPGSILDAGTLNLVNTVPEEYKGAVYSAYNATIIQVFYVGVACACMTICAIGIEWKSVKEEKSKESSEVGSPAL
ncbi:Major facilitator superfamily domain general substrate transporter [Penicillium expansum]|nr:Major facilitator superfamily domain general substrate transporter [Penicillium expansum]